MNNKTIGTVIVAFAAVLVQIILRNSPIVVIVLIMASSFIIGLLTLNGAKKVLTERSEKKIASESPRETSSINIDKFHGQLVASLPIWFFGLHGNMRLLALFMSFILFLICVDERSLPTKLISRRWGDKPFGIMLDDTVAGLISAVSLAVFLFIFYRP
jgi:phosphatidylglycerophosphatase A